MPVAGSTTKHESAASSLGVRAFSGEGFLEGILTLWRID
jgi:hypothetical protein